MRESLLAASAGPPAGGGQPTGRSAAYR